jgi:crossover junction endodeoxyribonuclease RuvC
LYDAIVIIIGIDPGYGRCGYAVLQEQDNERQLLDYGTIKTESVEYFPLRLEEIATDFVFLLKKYQPNILSIEDLFFAKNVTTGLKVSQVRGVLMLLAHQHGLTVIEPKPVEIKSFFTGNGKASKADMKRMAHSQFNLPSKLKLDDAADAIAAALYGLHMADIPFLKNPDAEIL